MMYPKSSPEFFFVIALSAIITTGCTSRRRASDSSERVTMTQRDGGQAVDSRCWDPGMIVPDITCGSAMPDVVCPGSCAQTLEGITGVGLSTCRCMDKGSGFGAQWICDTSACDADASDASTEIPGNDGGVSDGSSNPTGRDAGNTDGGATCEPAVFPPPTEPGCTTAQYSEILGIVTPTDYQAFVNNPSNADCNLCLSMVALACGTSMGCDRAAGNVFCCLDEQCGDNAECRVQAVNGACLTEANALNQCVAAIPVCGLNPANPPAECFP